MFAAIVGELHRAIPNSQMATVPDAAHIVHLEDPKECNKAAPRFLTDHAH